jgi:hypothetical protein
MDITKRKILVLISNLLKKMLTFSSQKRYRPKTFLHSKVQVKFKNSNFPSLFVTTFSHYIFSLIFELFTNFEAKGLQNEKKFKTFSMNMSEN